jgi:hypothetical protein
MVSYKPLRFGQKLSFSVKKVADFVESLLILDRRLGVAQASKFQLVKDLALITRALETILVDFQTTSLL